LVTVNMYNQYANYSWNQSGGSAYLVVSNGTSSDTLRKVVTGAVLSVDLCLVDDCWDVTFYDGGSGYLSEYSWDVTDTSGAVLASGGGYPSGFSGASVTDAHSFAVGSAVCAVYGCTDPTALNYDSTATVDDGSCIAIVYGCTDSTAINYFPGANVDDGSCCLVAGCTDPTASNYDPLACIDDGSCLYSTTCSGSPITNLGVTNIIHNRATFTFDDMNSSTCRVDQLRIKYREVAPAPTSSVSACSDFTSGPSAWPHVLTAVLKTAGPVSQGAQSYTMNVTSLPAGGANFRVVKTVANGNFFNGPAQALTLGVNTFTVGPTAF